MTTTRMLAEDRRARIMQMLESTSSVAIADICRECGVSAVTARGDLTALEKDGRLKRTHGGAVLASEHAIPRVPQRLRKNAKAKHAIARAAAGLVSDGETILVGSGSTTLEFLHALTEKRGLTVITNDWNLIDYAADNLPNVAIASTGGILGREYRHYFGPMVVSSLENVFVDKVFLGADGFDPEYGFFTEYGITAETKMEFLRHARNKIMLIDSSKVGAQCLFVRFARPTDVDIVVMDRDPDGVVAKATQTPDGHIRVICAE